MQRSFSEGSLARSEDSNKSSSEKVPGARRRAVRKRFAQVTGIHHFADKLRSPSRKNTGESFGSPRGGSDMDVPGSTRTKPLRSVTMPTTANEDPFAPSSPTSSGPERWSSQSMPEVGISELPEPIPEEWDWRNTFEQDPRLPAAAREKVELKRIQSFASLHPPELFKDLEQHKLDALRELKSVLKEELAATPSQYPEVIGCARLLRFLKGFQYNVDETAEIVRNSLKWRAENNVDKVRNDIVDNNLSIEAIPNYSAVSEFWHLQMFRSKDKEGNPIVYDPLGALKVDAMLKQTTKEDVVQFFMYLMEYRMLLLDRLSRQAGRLLFVYEIKDIAGLGSHVRHAMDIVKAIGQMTAQNYVETVRRVSVINTPFVFKALYGLVKPLIPERTVHKIRILGSGTDELEQDIDTHSIDPDHRLFDPRPIPKPPPTAQNRAASAASAAADDNFALSPSDKLPQRPMSLDGPIAAQRPVSLIQGPVSAEMGNQQSFDQPKARSTAKVHTIKTQSPRNWWIGMDPGLVCLALMLALVMLWMMYNLS